ncbi:MAG: UDP-2,3-diacylglucosamine diphosphatase LpxI [Proteobacteria bacterium]|nr:LpxI family protein [Desulfobulbaceae bacterium]MBU4151686.1 UDP-2,3-diacylglucosamine diphosphatase LpxI [Pseudomonadota bacterium]MDP2106716.1 UDP-2,3-diacylglucosamine diphosphatase LpxI [Desulfobulbaceae bacterium]
MPSDRIGIIAGGGQFPLLFAQAAKARGREVVVVGHRNETDSALEVIADIFCWVKLGQLGKIIKFFKTHGVSEAAFLGTITKTRIFSDVMPDLKGLTLWNKIDIKHDDSILRAIATALEEEGIRVVESTLYLRELLFPCGILTKKKPSSAQMDDIRFGWRVGREIGRLDIGQCVVVRDSTVLAVEAIEGTDAAIKRGGALGRGKAVVVKMKKPDQDFRFDLPATGPKTIDSMIEAQAAVLAVEAGQSLLFDRDEVLMKANKAGIVIVGLVEGAEGPTLEFS